MFHRSTPLGEVARLLGEIAEIDPRSVATAVAEAVAQGLPGPRDDALLLDLADLAEVGRLRERLARLIEDPRAALDARAMALDLLMRGEATRYGEASADVGEDVLEAASRWWIRRRLLDTEDDIGSAPDRIRDWLVAAGAADLRRVFGWVEGERRRLGTPAGLVYAACLGRPDTADVEPLVMAVLADEPDSFAVRAAEVALAEAEPERAAHWQAVRASLADAVARRPPPRPRTEAWASACDGEGRFTVEVCVHRPAERPAEIGHLGFSLTMHVDETIAEGAIDCMVTDEALGRWRARRDAGARGRVEVGFAEVAARARACRPEDHRSARVRAIGRLVEWLSRAGDALAPRPAPGAAPTVSGLLERLRRPPFEMWLLDGHDIEEIGCPAPDEADEVDRSAWLAQARAAFVESGQHRPWVACARYMAWWFDRAGDTDEAGLWASAARGMERDPDGAPLTRAIIEHSAIFELGGPGDVLDEHRWRHDREGYLEAVIRLAAAEAAPGDVEYDPGRAPDRDRWLALDEGQRVVAATRWGLREEAPEEHAARRWLAFTMRVQARVETRLLTGGRSVTKDVFARVRRGRTRADAIRLVMMATACALDESPFDSSDAAVEALLPRLLKLG